MNSTKKKNGFTLVEILTVVAIIGILALIVLPNFISNFGTAKNRAMITQENEVVDAAKLFLEDYCKHPLSQNKGQCSSYSLNTNQSGKKYTCLNVLQSTKYIEPIVSQGNYCSGFVIYDNNYKNHKAYLKCGDSYATSGIDNMKNDAGNKIIELCGGDISYTPDPTPDPTPTIVENYLIVETGLKYETLNEVFSTVSNNQTIKILQDATETTKATLESTKTGIKLDLNGKKLTLTVSNPITNKGELDVYNSSSAAAGTIIGNELSAIYNSGKLTINGTSNIYTTIIRNDDESGASAIFASSSGITTINNNTQIIGVSNDRGAIDNSGTLNMIGGTVTNNNYSGIDSDGTFNITGGIVKGTRGLYNHHTGVANISGNTTKIIGMENNGIDNFGATSNISGGTIIGNKMGIWSQGTIIIGGESTKIQATTEQAIYVNTGSLTVTGGTITSAANCIEAAYGSAKSITIGSNDGYVSTATPIIQTTGNSSKYGIRFWDDTTFNFYDGVIKSASGTGYAIHGTISDKPSGYNLYKETIGGVEELKLINN